jgi:tetratricopeptide (TPR) repeat protein
MPEYLLTGRDSRGKSRTERVEAGSANEAVRIAREEVGLDEVVLHDDDIMAHYSLHAQSTEMLSPGDYLKFRSMPAWLAGFLVVSKGIYLSNLWAFGLAIGLLGFRRWRGYPWGWLDWFQVAILVSPCVFAAIAQLFRGQAGLYNRLSDAGAWGRWEEALRLADRLEGGAIPPEELAFQRGRALAGLGRLEDGRALVEPFSDGVAMPEWLYHGRVADLYHASNRPEEARSGVERARELAPENPTVLLDLANFEVRHGRDPRRARELLNQARGYAMSDLLVVMATVVEGQIVRAEGRHGEALPLLESGYRQLSAYRHSSPEVGRVLDLVDAELALAHAGAGDHEAAKHHARRALPRLRAWGSDERITQLRTALGPGFEG